MPEGESQNAISPSNEIIEKNYPLPTCYLVSVLRKAVVTDAKYCYNSQESPEYDVCCWGCVPSYNFICVHDSKQYNIQRPCVCVLFPRNGQNLLHGQAGAPITPYRRKFCWNSNNLRSNFSIPCKFWPANSRLDWVWAARPDVYLLGEICDHFWVPNFLGQGKYIPKRR